MTADRSRRLARSKDGFVSQTSGFPQVVKGTVNFAADRSDGGVISNNAPETSRKKLLPVEVELRNMRTIGRSPTLQGEGFVLVAHPAGAADWSNDEWLESEYVPSCVELVKKLTGAERAVSMHPPILRRADPKTQAGAVPTAHFIHLDNTRDSAQGIAAGFAKAEGFSVEHGAIYNVWKALTPPPQDLPLAIADWRTVSENDHVVGMTVEPPRQGPGTGPIEGVKIPHVCLAHSAEAPDWYYAPDMSVDETLVFVGVDLDPSHPLGCPHTAFAHPDPEGRAVPRTSIEVRVLVFD
jgi:hypothetical protein